MSLLELFEGLSEQVVNLIYVLKWHFQRGFDECFSRLCSFSKLSENKREEFLLN